MSTEPPPEPPLSSDDARGDAAPAGRPATDAARRRARSRPSVALIILSVLLVALIAAIALLPRLGRMALSQQELGDLAHATLQREIAAAFLVTGELQVTATTRVRNTKTLLPGLFDVDLGTTSAAVRVPGRIIYGIDVEALDRGRIDVHEDGVIVITLPKPRVYAVEPQLSEMEVETRRGWARLSRETERDVRERAIELVESTLRAQGQRHLESSTQPRINTAEAIAAVLRPALVAAGIEEPTFRFVLGPSLIWQDR